MRTSALGLALVVLRLALVDSWWSGSDDHPALFVRGRGAPLSPSSHTFHEQSVVGVQVGVAYNVSVTLSVAGNVIFVHHVMIRVQEEKEEEFVYIKFPPVPEGHYGDISLTSFGALRGVMPSLDALPASES